MDVSPLLPIIAEWAPRQRWYPLREAHPMRILTHWSLREDVHILLVAAADVVLQVPIAIRDRQVQGTIGVSDSGYIVDACLDADALAVIFAATGSLTVSGSVPEATRIDAFGGEQSNTSVIGRGRRPWMAKVFRVVSPGENPDIVVTGALTRAGVAQVPALLASVSGTWAESGVQHRAHLVAVSEYIDMATDGWTLATGDAALDAARGSALDARALGAAVAEVHSALADAFGSSPATDADSDTLHRDLAKRLDMARSEAGAALDSLEHGLRRYERSIPELRLGRVQHIHGDLHLGQVLFTSARGWVLLDFEGEPLRPMEERFTVQPPERDIAGMLRSFDYAAGFAARTSPAAASSSWVQERSDEFLAGYGADRMDDALTKALTIDKALYELVYEMRNRPDWVDIPLNALRGLVQ